MDLSGKLDPEPTSNFRPRGSSKILKHETTQNCATKNTVSDGKSCKTRRMGCGASAGGGTTGNAFSPQAGKGHLSLAGRKTDGCAILFAPGKAGIGIVFSLEDDDMGNSVAKVSLYAAHGLPIKRYKTTCHY